jgi:hypothetical protein
MAEFAGGALSSVVPVIDGMSLIDLVGEFEAARELSPAGGYGGLIPETFHYGDLTEYFTGKTWRDDTRIWVLGCECGEAGCWPLETRIDITGSTVAWSEFRQPYRPEWDYHDFGPFLFDRRAYEVAVESAAAQIPPHRG